MDTNMVDPTLLTPPGESMKRAETRRVFHAIDQFCSELMPGDKVPTHTELMRRFSASERMVLRALDEMRRSGRIVRRTGSGTFVTERSKAGPLSTQSPARTVVALARPDHSFFDRCMEQLSQYTDEADLDLVCRPLRPEREAMLTWESLGSPYGCILFGYNLETLASQLRGDGARVVLVATPPPDALPSVACVFGAQMRGGYLAAKHLLDLGHRRLAYLNDGHDQTLSRRWHGIKKALREADPAGLSPTLAQLTLQEVETWRDAPGQAAAWVRHTDAPTGVIAWNDDVALRFLSILVRAGIRVPEEISVIGYDALPEGEQAHPALTTIEPFLGELLQTAVDLLNQPKPPPFSHTATVIPALIVRQSTSPPAARL